MSFILLGILNAQALAGGAAYYFQMLASQVEFSENITVDANDDFYVVGRAQYLSAGSYDLLLVKFNKAGIVQWQRVLGGASPDYGMSVTVDSSGYIVVVGYTSSAGAGANDVLLAKYDSSGTIQWQRVFGSNQTETAKSLSTDSSDNIYLTGTTDNTSGRSNDLLIVKYNSSGTLQWDKLLGLGNYESGEAIAINSIGDVFVVGQTQSAGAGSSDGILVKYNSSGAVQWQRSLGGASGEILYGLTISSTGDIYVVGQQNSATANTSVLIAKYNSSGTIQWQRIIGGALLDTGYSVTLDSSDNVYVAGDSYFTGYARILSFIAKYNSSGTIQWQRTIDHNPQTSQTRAVKVGSFDNVYLVGSSRTSTPTWGVFIASIPQDGSLTGTYSLAGVNRVYAASSLTAATSTLTASTLSLNTYTASFTSSTSSLTAGTTSITDYRVDL